MLKFDVDGESQAKAQHVPSFEEHCLPLKKELVGFARKLTSGDHQTADDVVQDALMKAWRAWGRFLCPPEIEFGHAVRGWLYRIVSNTFVKAYHRGRVRREAEMDKLPELLDGLYGGRVNLGTTQRGKGLPMRKAGGRNQFSRAGATACPCAEPDDLREHIDSPFGDEVLDAIACLSAEHRDVIEWFYGRAMSCEEIAVELGIPKNTVFTRLTRAREALAPRLRRYAPTVGVPVAEVAPRAAIKPIRRRARGEGASAAGT